MCILLGVNLNGTPLKQELTQAILTAQIMGSKVHSDGFGYFAASGDRTKYGRTQVAAIDSMFPGKCMQSMEEDEEFIITHIRKASSGRVVLPKNATPEEANEYQVKLLQMSHPFLGERSVLAHNGTLSPNENVEFEMDSLYLAQVFDVALAGKPVAEALTEAFSHFKDGYASLMFGVRYENGWVPYFYKGNKPLDRWVCEKTGITIVTTNDVYLVDGLRILNTLYDYDFKEVKVEDQGLYSFTQQAPLVKMSLISAPVQKAIQLPGAWKGNSAPKGNSPGGNLKGSGDFDKYIEEVGRAGLTSLTTDLLTRLTSAEIIRLIDKEETDFINVLKLIADNNFEEAKALCV